MTGEMTTTHGQDESAIGLRQYADVLWRQKFIVLLIVAFALAAAAVFTFRQQPEYKARTTIVVGQAGGLVQPQNASAIQPFSATMQELIRSTAVARLVIGRLGLPQTPDALLSQVAVSFNPESAALNVSVVDRYPEQARAIAAEIGVVFSELVKERFGRPDPGNPATSPLTATVWDPAHVIPGRLKPTPKLNLMVAGILGLVLGLLAALLRDYFDRRLRTADEIEQAFGLPVIGQIPSVRRGGPDRPRMLWDENGDFAEAFRALRANLQYLGVNRPLRTILITSPSSNQGKTTVAANVATALAQSGASVAVLEADLRRPQLGDVFQIPQLSAGLTTVLVGKAELRSVVSEIELPAGANGTQGEARHVAVLASGPLPPNPSELVGSSQMQQVIDELGGMYDHVIIDSPPMLVVADSLELANHADGVIVVARLKHTTRDAARELRVLANRLGIHLVGVVVTDVPVRVGYGYASYAAPGPPRQGSPVAALTLSTDHVRVISPSGHRPGSRDK